MEEKESYSFRIKHKPLKTKVLREMADSIRIHPPREEELVKILNQYHIRSYVKAEKKEENP
jgi:hypothetical protein